MRSNKCIGNAVRIPLHESSNVCLTLTGAFQRIMIECKLDSYYDEPNIVYLTQTVLPETAITVLFLAVRLG